MNALLLVALMTAAVTSTFDPYTKQTEIQFTQPSPESGYWTKIQSIVTVKDGKAGVPSVLFTSYNHTWRYLRCQDMKWLADGEPVETLMTTWDGQVVRKDRYTSGTLEYVTQLLSLDSFKQIASAQAVRYRVCGDEYELSPSELAAFADMVAQVEALTQQPIR